MPLLGAAASNLSGLALDDTVEAWREVGAGGQPAFENGWVNYGSADDYNTAGFYRDASGMIHLKGLVKNGSAATIFTLPAGYRPAVQMELPVANATGGSGTVIVTTAGLVIGGQRYSNAWISLDGVSFPAAALPASMGVTPANSAAAAAMVKTPTFGAPSAGFRTLDYVVHLPGGVVMGAYKIAFTDENPSGNHFPNIDVPRPTSDDDGLIFAGHGNNVVGI